MPAITEAEKRRRNRAAKVPPASWAASQAGPREDNEDDYGRADSSVHGYPWREKGCLYVLADGMGGLRAGREAARVAVRAVIDGYMRHEASGDVRLDIQNAVEHANLEVLRYAEEQNMRTGCTVVACVLKDGVATFAHVGDSRLYQWENGVLSRRTRDHLFATEMLGLTDDDEAKRRPDGHKITRALGQGPEVKIDISQAGYTPSDRFLLCSDGLSEVLEAGEIGRAMAEPTPERVVRGLFDAARSRLTDNATGIVVFASGRGVRTRQRLRWGAFIALALTILAGVAVGGVLGWRLYSRTNSALGRASKEGVSGASAKGIPSRPKTQRLTNQTQRPVWVWKEDDPAFRVFLGNGAEGHVDLALGEGASRQLRWCYQGDDLFKIDVRPVEERNGRLVVEDLKLLKNETAGEEPQGGQSNAGSQASKNRR
jgi:protein phosphatase